MYPGNPMGWVNSGWLWWIPTGLMMMLLWGLVIVALIMLVRWLWTQGPPGIGAPSAETALDILKKRYARGEITKEEFDRIKQDLL
jgi:putative membrane protein